MAEQGAVIEDLLRSSVLRNWLDRAQPDRLYLGLEVAAAFSEAERAWTRLMSGAAAEEVFVKGPDVPDILQSLGRLLEPVAQADPQALGAITAIYELASAANGPLTNEDERQIISARFAFLAWDHCRQLERFPEMRKWEVRCEGHVLSQAAIRDYFSLKDPARKASLAPSFLANPETVLMLLSRRTVDPNFDPASSLHFFAAIFQWLQKGLAPLGEDQRAYFAGELAYLVAGALRHLGRFNESIVWESTCASWFNRTKSPAAWLRKIGILTVSRLISCHQVTDALEILPALVTDLERFGLATELQLARLAYGIALKNCRQPLKAMDCFRQIVDADQHSSYSLVRGLAIANMAGTMALLGDAGESIQLLARARETLAETGVVWAVSDVDALLGETLQESGHISEAIEAYSIAVRTADELAMEARAAYLRLVLAHAMMIAGRDDDARQEILRALPVLDRELVMTDAITAIALLRTSLRRQNLDPDVLRDLRLQIEKIRQGGQS